MRSGMGIYRPGGEACRFGKVESTLKESVWFHLPLKRFAWFWSTEKRFIVFEIDKTRRRPIFRPAQYLLVTS